jgi:hypothetical protein
LEKDESQAMRLAGVHLRLAEIHEESDNIAAAIKDEGALGLTHARLEPHSPLAFDYSLENRSEGARKAHVVKAAECVEKQLALLEDEVAGDKGNGCKSEDSPAATEEIAELRGILEDLREGALLYRTLAMAALSHLTHVRVPCTRSKASRMPLAKTLRRPLTTTATPVECEETKGKRKRTYEHLLAEQPADSGW